MLSEYNVTVHIDGHYTIEDPKCPLSWRGSGCYDIEVETWCDDTVGVWATDEKHARGLVESYEDFARGYTIEIDDIKIEKVELVGSVPDYEDDDAGVLDDFDFNWKEHTNEPPERDW